MIHQGYDSKCSVGDKCFRNASLIFLPPVFVEPIVKSISSDTYQRRFVT